MLSLSRPHSKIQVFLGFNLCLITFIFDFVLVYLNKIMKMLSPLPYSVHKGILIAKLSFVIQCFFFLIYNNNNKKKKKKKRYCYKCNFALSRWGATIRWQLQLWWWGWSKCGSSGRHKKTGQHAHFWICFEKQTREATLILFTKTLVN